MAMPSTAVPLTEIGYAQAPHYNWWQYQDETTPELMWPQSISVYDAMRRTDSQVTSVLRAMTLPVRSTPWRIDPNGAADEVVQLVADDLGLPVVGQAARTPPPRSADRFSWKEHLRQALLMLPFGHMYFEQVYRVDPDGSRAHLRKLAPRMPKTIERIDVAPDGGLISIQQYWTQLDRRPEPIPVNRLVAYIHEREGGNWLGQSILRPGYKNWLLKDRLLRVQAQTIERNGMGIPLYEGPEEATDLSAGLAMAKAWRAGEAAGSAIPHGAKLSLVGVSGTLPDAEPAIRYHDEQIGRAVLAHFLNLGTQTGSWALGTTFADFFTLSLQTLAQQIADTATCHIVEDLVDVNFGPDEPAPRIVFDEIGSRQAATAQALSTLFAAGAVVPDDLLEEMLRQQYGLPARDPATSRTPPSGAPGVGTDGIVDTGATSVAAAAGEGDEVTAKFNPAELRDMFGRWAKSLKGRGRTKPTAVQHAPSLSDLAAELEGLTPQQSREHLRGVGLSETEIDDLIGPDAPVSMSDLAHELEGLAPAQSRAKLRRYGFTDKEIRDLLGSVVSAAADASQGGDEDPDDGVDEAEDDEVAILLTAMAEFAGEVQAASFNPSLHARYPKGHALAGQFRPMIDRLIEALNHHVKSGGGNNDPFATFSREPLRKAAVARGIKLPRGASRDDIVLALVADLTPGGKSKATAPATPPVATLGPLPAGITVQSHPRIFGNSTVRLAVSYHGTYIGSVHDSAAGWYGFAPPGSGWNVNNNPGASRDDAIKVLIDAHNAANPPTAPKPKVTTKKTTTRTGMASSYVVSSNGVGVGAIHRSSTGTWHADPSGSGTLTAFSSRKAAIDALTSTVGPTASSTVPGATAIPGVTTRPMPGVPQSRMTALLVSYNGTDIGEVYDNSLGWFAHDAHRASLFAPSGGNAFSTKDAALQALLDTHLATVAPPPAPAAPTASLGPVRLHRVTPLPPGSPSTYLAMVGGQDIGRVEGRYGWTPYPPSGATWTVPTSTGKGWRTNSYATRKEAVAALEAAYAAHLASQAAPTPPAATRAAPDPAVRAAQDVLYGIDPKATTAARQLTVYGGLKRAHFDNLDPSEQSTLLGDLSYIATTSKGPNARKAQDLFDRFTPPGTPIGSVPKQAIIPPASATAAQMRVPDPAGTPGLLKMRPTSQRGKSGDGWTRTATGGSGPWGQYGAAGLMLRHVDDKGVERYLMVERGPGISDPGKWQFPGGAKEELETYHEGAAREVIEELGFKPKDLDGARVHGTHTNEVASVQVPGLHGGKVPWAYVSIAATVPDQLVPDLSTHHARMETSDAKWMTAAEIKALDTNGKLLRPLAGGQLEQNVMSLFPPPTAAPSVGRPGSRTTRPPRLTGAPPAPKAAHKPSKGRDLVSDKTAQDKLRADVKATRKTYRGKTADERLAAIGAIQGYDDTPTVVSKAEMDRLLATGDYIEAWRGVEGTASSWRPRKGPAKTAAQIHEDMRSGPAFYGTGIFGNGYYLTTIRDKARDYSDGTKNSIIRVLIPKSAKTDGFVAVHRRASATQSSNRQQFVGNRQGDTGGVGTLRDPGRYAAAEGLDGIEITSGISLPAIGGSSHIARPGQPAYNWVNRSVLIIQEADA